MRHAEAALDELEAAAKAAHAAETDFRAEMAREIARIERERVFAFRRVRLARLLAVAAEAAGEGEDVGKAQRRALASELGWDADGERHRIVLDRVEKLGASLRSDSAAGVPVSPFSEALKEFEAWYQAHAGEPFYDLFDQYVPETPLVDF